MAGMPVGLCALGAVATTVIGTMVEMAASVEAAAATRLIETGFLTEELVWQK